MGFGLPGRTNKGIKSLPHPSNWRGFLSDEIGRFRESTSTPLSQCNRSTLTKRSVFPLSLPLSLCLSLCMSVSFSIFVYFSICLSFPVSLTLSASVSHSLLLLFCLFLCLFLFFSLFPFLSLKIPMSLFQCLSVSFCPSLALFLSPLTPSVCLSVSPNETLWCMVAKF